jgi:chromosome partitioning protein
MLTVGKVIVFANQKGGVGKTTSCVNLGASLRMKGRNVLVIDLDPQGNATMGSGINKNDLDLLSYHFLLNKSAADDVICSTKAGYDLIPSNRDLTAAEVELISLSRKEFFLLQALVRIKGRYDYILIDCPPSLSMLTINALVAADSVLIPVQCEYYALEGLSSLTETITTVQENINKRLVIEGVLRTMYDSRNRLTKEVSEQLEQYFSGQVFKTVIPRNVRLAEAPSFGLPVLLYERSSQGAGAYLQLAEEMITRRAE